MDSKDEKNCIFCKIIKGTEKVYIVGQSQNVLAILAKFNDCDGHILLIPKKHFIDVTEMDINSWTEILYWKKIFVDKLTREFNAKGFNFVNNMGSIADQTVFHYHMHVIPKYEEGKGYMPTRIRNPILSFEEVQEKLMNCSKKNNNATHGRIEEFDRQSNVVISPSSIIKREDHWKKHRTCYIVAIIVLLFFLLIILLTLKFTNLGTKMGFVNAK